MPVIPALREDRGVRSPWPVSATQGNHDQPGLHEIASKVTRQMEKESSERERESRVTASEAKFYTFP